MDALHRAGEAADKLDTEKAKFDQIRSAADLANPAHVSLLKAASKRVRTAGTLCVRAHAALHDELKDREVHKR